MKSLILIIGLVITSHASAAIRAIALPKDAENPRILSLLVRRSYSGQKKSIPCTPSEEGCNNGNMEVPVTEEQLELLVAYQSKIQADFESDSGQALGTEVTKIIRLNTNWFPQAELYRIVTEQGLQKRGPMNREWANELLSIRVVTKEMPSREIDYSRSQLCPFMDQEMPIPSESCERQIVFKKGLSSERFLFIETR